MTSISALDNLPVRVLLHNQPVSERVEIATVSADFRTGRSRTGDRPLRNPGIPSDEMRGLAVVDVRQPLETPRQSLADGRFANRTGSPWVAPAWHLQNAIFGEVAHDPVEI